MRPLKITMSAFGSYGDVETLDFADQVQGIFLITGDTGSGKTTVFDAMMYALYDETSGGRRDGPMMRSQYAKGETETYVAFTFLYRKEIYHIRRNPEYLRPGKRAYKDGTARMVREAARVELVLPDGSVFPGKKRETDQKIAEIIGLDSEQFRQVAMIAQGDFLKLLHAESRERKLIFSKIFHTKIYWHMQELLKSKARALAMEIEDTNKQCRRELEGVSCGESPFYDRWRDCIEEAEFSLESTVEVLEDIVSEEKKDLESLQQKRKERKQYLAQLKTLMEGEERTGSSRKKLQETKKGIDGLESWLNQQRETLKVLAEEHLKQEQALKKEEPILNKEIAQLQESLKKYEAIDVCSRKLKASLKERTAMESSLQKLDKEELTGGRKQKSLEESLKRLENMPLKQMEAQAVLKKVCQEQESVKELWEQVMILGHMNEEQETAKTVYRQKQERAVELGSFYEGIYRRFFQEQAGILAGELEGGKPCPVCGALVHPAPAILSEEAPSQLQVEHARMEREKAEKEREEAYLNLKGVQQRYEGKYGEITRRGCQLLGLQRFSPNEKGMIRVQKESDLLKAKVERAQNALEKILLMSKKEEAIQQELRSLEAVLQEIGRRRGEAEQEKNRIEIQIGALKKEEEYLRQELSFENPGQAKRELDRMEKKLKNLKAAAELSRSQEQKLLGEFSLKTGEHKAELLRYRQLERELQKMAERLEREYVEWTAFHGELWKAGKTEGEAVSVLQQQEKHLEGEEAALEKRYMEQFLQYRKNQEALLHLKAYKENQRDLLKDYMLYNDLSRTANGNLKGSMKLDFETYVQRQYFKQIIFAANKRLVLMNNQQFILQCRELENLGTQGQVGLDLDVYHIVNNSVRDIKTLSGGESFMAALAMALGLADIIQNEAGAIRLDTMFVDEGFGSLDDEARGQAIQVLLELAGSRRLVGIISHVNELKEQIEKKLLVTKNDRGSHAQWV